MRIEKWRFIIVALVTIISIFLVLPNFYDNLPFNLKKINLGLDLKGGVHLLLSVNHEEYINDKYVNIIDNIKQELRTKKLGYKYLAFSNSKIVVTPRQPEHLKQLKALIRSVDSKLSIEIKNEQIIAFYNNETIDKILDMLIEQSVEVIRMRVDSSGTKEPNLQRQGQNNILLQVPGLEEPEMLKKILGQTAKLTFHLVEDRYFNPNQLPKGTIAVQEILPKNDTTNGSENSEDQSIQSTIERTVFVQANPILTGDMLANANTSFNQYGQPVVAFALNSHGTKIFANATKNNKGKRIAIVMDKKLLSDPVVNEPILGGTGIISGNFTLEKANELALLLRAGSLLAPISIVEERIVGPTLGIDAVHSGKNAGLCALLVTMVIMFLIYGILGLLANISLLFTFLYIFAILSALNATLTLPGIAGLILTIGMAVDANILIYERMREEFKNGEPLLSAIHKGFDGAFSTILDSNITTLIGTSLLYTFGVGVIKGFAVTLTVGVVGSMFSSIVITKLLIACYVRYFSKNYSSLLKILRA